MAPRLSKRSNRIRNRLDGRPQNDRLVRRDQQSGNERAGADFEADISKSTLSGGKGNRRYTFTDVLPRNPSGKSLKRELRKPYWEGQERQVH